MAINFPDSPSVGDSYTVGAMTWTYDGTTWKGAAQYFSYIGNIDGGTPTTIYGGTNSIDGGNASGN